MCCSTVYILQVNPDDIDVTKVPDLPPRSQEVEDVYALLYDDAMQFAGEFQVPISSFEI